MEKYSRFFIIYLRCELMQILEIFQLKALTKTHGISDNFSQLFAAHF